MCLFPLVNNNIKGLAYRKGVREFDCGACPECLRKRSNVWALRSVYEARAHVSNLMVTLTYDNFNRDPGTGKILGELPVNPYLEVNKRDIQLFIKRLRKWYSSISDEKIKYIACAEYGSHTHRAHYHLILFGVRFPDYHFYKKSKRGNPIYMSSILTRLWSHGICTIDSINVHSAVARYCTKYCAKSRSDNTFMLCSQHIGLNELLKDFNGYNYMIEGREYSIPRCVWQEYIMRKYSRYSSIVSYKYYNLPSSDIDVLSSEYQVSLSHFYKNRADRKRYRYLRDRDPVYLRYLDYWQHKGLQFEQCLLKPIQRIYLLDERKFHSYKTAALAVYTYRSKFIPFPAPGSNCISAYYRYLDKISLHAIDLYRFKLLSTCPLPSRPNRASDTNSLRPVQNFVKSPFVELNSQLSFF